MASSASLPLRVGLMAGLLLAIAATGAPAQEKVGVNSAVNPEAVGTPPGGTARKLVIGQDVVFNERITTTDGGQTQLLFLDQSAMTIGPNSDLTIDQFVYDPRSGTGKLAMSATRGVLRYVGGKLSKQDNAVTLRTSTATLAVRGGAFIANILTDGTTEAIFVFGHGLTVVPVSGQTDTIRRPGFQIVVTTAGSSGPIPVSPQQLAQLLARLDGRTGGTGGAGVIPTDTIVGASGISQTVSGDIGASLQQAGQNQVLGASAPQTQQLNTGGVIQQATTICDNATCTSINSNAGTPTNTNPPTTTVAYGGQLRSTNPALPGAPPAGSGTTTGFVAQTPNGKVPYAGGTLSFPTGSPQSGVFAGNFGNLGTISFPLVPGSSSFGPQGTASSFGTFSGSTFLSADNTFFYATIAPTSQPTQRLFVFGGTPTNPGFYQPTGNTRVFAFSVQPDAALQSSLPFIRSQAGGNLAGGVASPFYIVAPTTTPIGSASTNAAARGLQASLAINGQGANQQSAIAVTAGSIGSLQNGQPVFNGALRGSSQLSASGQPVGLGSPVGSAVDGNNNSFYGSNAISGFVLDTAGSTASEAPLSGGSTAYGFSQPVLPTAVPSGVGTTRTTQALSGGFGGLMYTTAQANPYIVTGGTLVSTDAATNRVQATLTGGTQSPSAAAGVSNLTMQYGSLSGTAGGQAFVDDKTFAALESQTNPQQMVVNGNPTQPTGQLYMVSSGAAGAPAGLLPSGVSYCNCQYLQWGYWGGDLTSVNSANPAAPRIDRGGINTWVAGVATPTADLNSLISQSATATYNGHAIGSVFNNGASYVAAGGFTGSYNFGTQMGTMAVNNFDGRSFAATGKAPLNGANYAFSAATPGVQGSINGTFFGPNAAETGGNFAFQTTVGPAYLASGIYAGKR